MTTNGPDPSNIDKPTAPWLSKHWAWFVVIQGLLGFLGFVLAFILMLPLGMATDGCHGSTTDWVCRLSARGQNFLVAIPWLCLFAGTIAAVVTAAVAARRRWTPLIGIPIGIAVVCAMIPVGKAIALHI